MIVQRRRSVFVTHISLTGKDCQILLKQCQAIFSQGNTHNACNGLLVTMFAAREMCVMHIKTLVYKMPSCVNFCDKKDIFFIPNGL